MCDDTRKLRILVQVHQVRAFLYFCFFVFFFVQFHIFCLTLCNLKNSECHVITARQRCFHRRVSFCPQEYLWSHAPSRVVGYPGGRGGRVSGWGVGGSRISEGRYLGGGRVSGGGGCSTSFCKVRSGTRGKMIFADVRATKRKSFATYIYLLYYIISFEWMLQIDYQN